MDTATGGSNASLAFGTVFRNIYTSTPLPAFFKKLPADVPIHLLVFGSVKWTEVLVHLSPL
jgi:hypothetical protein